MVHTFFFSIVCCCAGGGTYGEGISAFSTHFNMDIFSFSRCVGVTQLVSEFLSCIAIHLVHLWKGGNSEAFYIAILVQSLAVLIVNA